MIVVERACDACGKRYEAKRATSRFCGSTCRVRASRGAAVIALPAPLTAQPEDSLSAPEPALVVQVRADLVAAEVLESSLGQMALAAAGRVANSRDTGSSYASLLREARAVLAEALRSGRQPDSAVQGLQDELAARRMA